MPSFSLCSLDRYISLAFRIKSEYRSYYATVIAYVFVFVCVFNVRIFTSLGNDTGEAQNFNDCSALLDVFALRDIIYLSLFPRGQYYGLCPNLITRRKDYRRIVV